jgi:hypothetical protein
MTIKNSPPINKITLSIQELPKGNPILVLLICNLASKEYYPFKGYLAIGERIIPSPVSNLDSSAKKKLLLSTVHVTKPNGFSAFVTTSLENLAALFRGERVFFTGSLSFFQSTLTLVFCQVRYEQ